MTHQISNPAKTALIVGANGVIGTNLINHLVSLGDWNIIGLSRRGGISSANITYIPVNLLDKEDTVKQLNSLSAVTHIFYTAYQDKPTWAELVEPNLVMLVNVVDAIEPIALNLQHISLMQGYRFMAPILAPLKHPQKKATLATCRPNLMLISKVFWNSCSKAKAGHGRPSGLR